MTNPQDVPFALAVHSRRGPHVDVKAYGAIGDGVADDFDRINDAIAVAEAEGIPLLFPRVPVGYRIRAGITIPSTVVPVMESPVIDASGADAAALTWGDASHSINHQQGAKLQVVRATQSSWASESCVGVRIYNLDTCRVFYVRSEGFTINVELVAADGDLCAYNDFGAARIVDGKIGLNLTAVNGGANNGSTFLRWRFAVNSATNPTLSRYGVRITHDGTATPLNEHTFKNCSFELSGAHITNPAAECVPALIEHGWQNSFESFREEGNAVPGGAPFVFGTTTNDSQDNLAYGLYGIANIDDRGTHPSSICVDRTNHLVRESRRVWDSGPVWLNSIIANGSTTWSVRGCGIGNSSSATVYAHNSGFTLGASYLETSSAAVGTMLDTTVAKRLAVKLNTISGYGGQIVIRCYDASGAVLNGSGTTYVLTHGGASVFWSSNYGGVYYSGSNVTATGFYFVVGASVAAVWIGVVAGSGGTVRLRSFSIYSVDGAPAAAWPGFGEIVPGANHGTAPPTTGTWPTGAFIVNVAPGATAAAGWVCTAGGTPGTWVAYVGAATGITSLPTQATPITVAANQSGYALDLRNSHASGSGVLIRPGSDSNNALAVVDAATGSTVKHAVRSDGTGLFAQGGGGSVGIGGSSNPRSARLVVTGKAEINGDLHLTAGGGADLATTATAGFLHITTSNGPPTGTPANLVAGTVPLHCDRSAKKLYMYTGGAWYASTAFT